MTARPALPRVERDNATPAQLAVLDELLIARGKPGGRLANLYAMLLHQPEIARRLGAVGAYLRFGVSLTELVREAAILSVCIELSFTYEQAAHEEIIQARGLSSDNLGRLKREQWQGMDPDLALAGRFARAASSNREDLADLTQAVLTHFGPAALVELSAIVAHYSALAVYDRIMRPELDPPGHSLAKPGEHDGC